MPVGSITFDATNDGPDDTNQFVVIMTDLGPTELPTDKDGVPTRPSASPDREGRAHAFGVVRLEHAAGTIANCLTPVALPEQGRERELLLDNPITSACRGRPDLAAVSPVAAFAGARQVTAAEGQHRRRPLGGWTVSG